ncbi:MAG TPA: M48 family metalloprotease [Solirubrobacteraceae bacterium]|nr:M48 family metalloprotease [Solirubrobacteraceae bacterium]
MRRTRVCAPIIAALAAAELAARLLTPRPPAPAPDPVDLGSHFSPEEIERGARFARPQLKLALARGALDAGALAAIVYRRPRALRDLPASPAGGAVAAAGLGLALSLPSLPLAVVARRRAVAVGLITQSWRGWAVDLVKANAIQSAFAAGAGGAVVALTRRYPRSWWAPAAAGSVLFGAVFAAIAPVVLDPIFNDFTPLPEGETRADVLALAQDAGVKVGEVYAVDASRRTTAANAYVTGLGPTKRVVLFDTLLDRYNRDEVRVVVAHELAHVKGRDVPRGVVFSAIVAPATALAVQRLSWRLSDERGTPAALPALALAVGTVAAPIGLIGNRLSRALERRADELSLELTGAADAFVSFERTIALQNVADLDPPRWVSTILATHPPTTERIGAALRYARSRRPQPSTAAT